MNVLLVEPYYTGSHKYWADNLVARSCHNVKLHTMPGRHWKWRMKGAAVHLADLYNEAEFTPDVIICTSMMDVSLYKSLIAMSGPLPPIMLYMHENQLTYPFSSKEKRDQEDFHYGFINIKSCVVSDRVIFNSHYHKNVFLAASESLRKRLPDYKSSKQFNIEKKSEVIYVGIEMDEVHDCSSVVTNHPTLLWNHRWDEDKNPDLFLRLCHYLEAEDIDFNLILLGGNSSSSPNKVYSEINNRFSKQILHSGFVDKSLYFNLLSQSSILPVTSNQDFYGISVLEAIYNGVTPLLPSSMVYEEFIPMEKYSKLYYDSEKELFSKTLELCKAEIGSLEQCVISEKHIISKTVKSLDLNIMDLHNISHLNLTKQ